MAVRAVTFDFWCTLFREANNPARHQLRVEAFSKATGQRPASVSEALNRIAREFQAHHIQHQSTLTPLDAVRMTADHVGIAVPPDVAEELADVFATAILHHAPEPIEGALDAVSAAAELRPVGIISDSGMSPGRSLRSLLARNGFIEHIEALAFSDEVGAAKPQALMFETCARQLGVQPSELLHIGDLEHTDIQGARALGAKTVLFGGDNPRYVGATQADYTFTSWRDFIAALPTLV